MSAVRDQDPEFVKDAFSGIADRYVLANHVLSLGIDVHWRRKLAGLVKALEPRLVLDVATGSGDLAQAVRRGVGENCTVTGTDFCEPMLREARRRDGNDAVTWMVADGMRLPFADGAFDALTIGFGLRNMESWAGALREMGRVLRPGGALVILDFSLPRAKWMRGVYRSYLHHVLPLLAGALTGRREAYEYLGESIERFPSGEAMGELLAGNGFEPGARWIPLSGGIASIYVGVRSYSVQGG